MFLIQKNNKMISDLINTKQKVSKKRLEFLLMES